MVRWHCKRHRSRPLPIGQTPVTIWSNTGKKYWSNTGKYWSNSHRASLLCGGKVSATVLVPCPWAKFRSWVKLRSNTGSRPAKYWSNTGQTPARQPFGPPCGAAAGLAPPFSKHCSNTGQTATRPNPCQTVVRQPRASAWCGDRVGAFYPWSNTCQIVVK